MKAQLFAPKEFGNQPCWFWDAPEEERNGGCGPGQGFGDRLVPDSLLGLSIKPACAIHDYQYRYGVTREDKAFADRVFRQNMNRIIHAAGGLLKHVRYCMATAYYLVVKYGGETSYWSHKHESDLQWVEI